METTSLLQQHIAHFLNAKRATKSPATVLHYELTLRYLAAHITEAGLFAWPTPPEAIDSFFAACRARKVKDSSLESYYRAIRCFFNWCEKRGKLADNPISLCERPRKVKFLPKYIPEIAIAQLLTTLQQAAGDSWINFRDYCVIILALETGMRVSELARLTIDKIDIERRTLFLVQTKDNKERKVVFSDQAAEILTKWLDIRARLSQKRNYTTNRLFITDQRFFGCALTGGGIAQMFARWQEKAGLEHINFHRLRHTHAVYFLRERGDLLDLQRQLGHANIATTQIYCSIDDTGRAERLNTSSPLARALGGAA